MLDKNLVEGFSVDTRMPKPDRIACTKAKQSVEPFSPNSNRKLNPEILLILIYGVSMILVPLMGITTISYSSMTLSDITPQNF